MRRNINGTSFYFELLLLDCNLESNYEGLFYSSYKCLTLKNYTWTLFQLLINVMYLQFVLKGNKCLKKMGSNKCLAIRTEIFDEKKTFIIEVAKTITYTGH